MRRRVLYLYRVRGQLGDPHVPLRQAVVGLTTSDKISYESSFIVDITRRRRISCRSINRMPNKGRPRLTLEELQARIADYCDRYGVAPNAEGLPPFPTGQRETQQHRDWIAVYKAHNRLARRRRGQCERCAAPASAGSIFCDAHRVDVAARAGSHGASLEERRALLKAQGGRCPVCGQKLQPRDSIDHSHANGEGRAVLHPRCSRLAGLVEALGPDSLDRLRLYLWPDAAAKPRSSRRALPGLED